MSETTLQAAENAEIIETEETVEEETVEKEKPYTLRKLAAKDVAPMTAILTKIGFKEFRGLLDSPYMKAAIAAFSGEENVNIKEVKIGIQLGFEIIGIVLENYEKCQDQLLAWLGSMSGMTKAEVGELGLDVFTEMLIDIFQKEEFKGFFSVVSKLFKQVTSSFGTCCSKDMQVP